MIRCRGRKDEKDEKGRFGDGAARVGREGENGGYLKL